MSETERPTADPEITERSAEGERFAKQNKIRLADVCVAGVVSEAQAAKFLEHLNDELPPVTSVYRPSGILPSSGFLTMVLGAIGGALAGTAALVVVGAMCSLIFGPVLWFNMKLLEAGFIWFLARFVLILVAVVAFSLTFGFAGSLSSIVVSHAGQKALNRNPDAAVIFARIAGVIPVAVAGVVVWINGDWIQEKSGMALQEFAGGVVIVVLMGGLLSAYVAARSVRESIEKNHFCETCQRFMAIRTIKFLSLGRTAGLAKAIEQHNAATAVSLCYGESGADGEVRLSECPRCAGGIIEVSLGYTLQWQKGNEINSKTETRLVASLSLAPDDIRQFKTIPTNVKDPRIAN